MADYSLTSTQWAVVTLVATDAQRGGVSDVESAVFESSDPAIASIQQFGDNELNFRLDAHSAGVITISYTLVSLKGTTFTGSAEVEVIATDNGDIVSVTIVFSQPLEQ